MERFLGLTKEEIEENSRLWFEEREEPEDNDAEGSDLRSIGISAGDLETDAESLEGMDEMPPEGEMGAEMGPAVGGPEMAGGAAGAGVPPPPM
jgi:hypothetical protein